MGSYNVSCGITQASIGPGDPCYLVLLVNDPDKPIGTRRLQGLMPVAIKGIYGDYARIKEVEDSPGLKALAGYFGITSEKFVDIILCHEGPTRSGGEFGEFLSPEVKAVLANYSILDGSIKDELVAFTWFVENLFLIAKELKPMNLHGPQFGDYQMLKHYGETIVKIANKALSERDLDY